MTRRVRSLTLRAGLDNGRDGLFADLRGIQRPLRGVLVPSLLAQVGGKATLRFLDRVPRKLLASQMFIAVGFHGGILVMPFAPAWWGGTFGVTAEVKTARVSCCQTFANKMELTIGQSRLFTIIPS